MEKKATVHIIGAGFSGLTLAWELSRKNIPVIIYEADKVGGLIQTHRTPSHLRETAANGVLWNPRFANLSQELNVEFIPTETIARKRYLFRHQKAYRWPLTFTESIAAVGYLITSPFRKIKGDSLRDWSQRLFGPIFTEYVLNTAIRGIFAAPAETLNAAAVLGSFKKIFPGKSMGTFAPTAGMGHLIQALQEKLIKKQIRFVNQSVQNIHSLLENKNDLIVLAVPAWHASPILKNSGINPHWLPALEKIKPVSLISATAVWPKSTKMLVGFGCLLNSKDSFHASGVLKNHLLFSNRGPMPSETWIFNSSTEISDSEVLKMVLQDRARLYPKENFSSPDEFYVQRWPKAIPLYNKYLHEFAEQYHSESDKGQLFLTGNYLGKIGLAKIYDYNILLAEKIFKTLHGSSCLEIDDEK